MAFTLGMVGDRWALLVVRELMFSAKGFRQIRAGMPAVTASVLTGRLREMIDAGLVVHDPESGRYGLTADGRALRPVLRELGRWGAGRPGHDARKFLSPAALMLSLEVMVDPAAKTCPDLGLGFELGRETFRVALADGIPLITAGEPLDSETVLVGAPNAVAAALYTPLTIAACVAGQMIEVRGDPAAAQRFADAFLTLGAG